MTISAATQAALDEGLRRFAAGLFWEAHEAWEEAWLVEDGLVKLGLQALIQLTAAFHKGLRMNNPRGMRKLLEESLHKLEHVSAELPDLGGVDLNDLTTQVRRGLAQEVATVPTIRKIPA